MPEVIAIDVVTLFPELFESPLKVGLVGRALRVGRARVRFVDPRSFAEDRHRSVDAAPYGGGAGMVMRVEPMARALRTVRQRGPGPIVLMSPQGRPVQQTDLARWARGEHLGLVCGRYEGFDERIRALVDEEVSVADVVLTGGEAPALVIMDGVIRLRPGTLGNAGSAHADSFSDGLLEHPQYTRPERFEDQGVPEVLLSGHHGRIEAWRREQKLKRTLQRRPELLAERMLSWEDRKVLSTLQRPRRVSLAVAFPDGELIPQDVARLARLRSAFGLERVVVVSSGAEAAIAATPSLEYWGFPGSRRRGSQKREASKTVAAGAPSGGELSFHPELGGWVMRTRRMPSELVLGRTSWAELPRPSAPDTAPIVLALSRVPSADLPVFSWSEIRRWANAGRPVWLVAGERAQASAPEGAHPDGVCPSLRQGVELNAFDAVTAAALALDRVLGEG